MSVNKSNGCHKIEGGGTRGEERLQTSVGGPGALGGVRSRLQGIRTQGPLGLTNATLVPAQFLSQLRREARGPAERSLWLVTKLVSPGEGHVCLTHGDPVKQRKTRRNEGSPSPNGPSRGSRWRAAEPEMEAGKDREADLGTETRRKRKTFSGEENTWRDEWDGERERCKGSERSGER